MSRSGYTDEDDSLAPGLWRQAVKKALQGKRGQEFLQELLTALDDMQDKRLWPGSFATAEGEFCALGVLGTKRGTKMDDLGDEDGCNAAKVGRRFGIARSMAAEIMYINDESAADISKLVIFEICGPVRPHWPDWGDHTRRLVVPNEKHAQDRWKEMRYWVAKQLLPSPKVNHHRETS